MSSQDIDKLVELLPNCNLIYSYGLTEASPRVTYIMGSDLLKKAGSSGRPIKNVKIEISNKPSGNSEIMCKMLSDVCYVELDDIGFKTLKLTDFIIHLCAHLYKEATTYDWVVGRRDLNLYKFSDINVLLRKMLDEKLCRALVERIKEFDIKNECYYTFYNSGLIYPKLYENQYFKQLLDGIKPESLRYMKQIVWPVKKELYEYQHDFIEWFLHKDRVNELKLVTEE